jgi:hypothetical protein
MSCRNIYNGRPSHQTTPGSLSIQVPSLLPTTPLCATGEGKSFADLRVLAHSGLSVPEFATPTGSVVTPMTW